MSYDWHGITARQVADLLGLQEVPGRPDHRRCPTCDSSGLKLRDRVWYCHRGETGGGPGQLVMHVDPSRLEEVARALGAAQEDAERPRGLLGWVERLEARETAPEPPRWAPDPYLFDRWRRALAREVQHGGGDVLDYLVGRGLTPGVLLANHVGARYPGSEVVLAYGTPQEPLGAKFRAVEGASRYRGLKGQGTLPLYRAWALRDHAQAVVVEGEIDALTGASMGFDRPDRIILGMSSGSRTVPRGIQVALARVPDVVFLPDQDHEMAPSVKAFIGAVGHRVRVGKLPRKDLNEAHAHGFRLPDLEDVVTRAVAWSDSPGPQELLRAWPTRRPWSR